MNRHHFSVYVRHCKLEVVLRREAGAAAEFRAAEWRWATPEVRKGRRIEGWCATSYLLPRNIDLRLRKNIIIVPTPFNAIGYNVSYSIVDEAELMGSAVVASAQ